MGWLVSSDHVSIFCCCHLLIGFSTVFQWNLRGNECVFTHQRCKLLRRMTEQIVLHAEKHFYEVCITQGANAGIFEVFFPQISDFAVLPAASRSWGDVRGTGLQEKSAASHATPVPVTPDHMPPCAAKPCHSSFPLGKQRPLSGQSLLWSCRAEAICSPWLLTVKWSSLFLVAALPVCCNQPVWFCLEDFLLGPGCLEKGKEAGSGHPLECLLQNISAFGVG